MRTDPDSDDDDFGDSNVIAPPVRDIRVDKAIPHESFEPLSKNQYHDIGLIRLAERVEYSQFIKPVCLPDSQTLEKWDINKVRLEVAGWGRTEK